MGFGEVGIDKVGFGKVGIGQVGFGQVGFGEVGFGEVGIGEVGFGEVGENRFQYLPDRLRYSNTVCIFLEFSIKQTHFNDASFVTRHMTSCVTDVMCDLTDVMM